MRQDGSFGGLFRGLVPLLAVSALLWAGGCHWGVQEKPGVPRPPDEREMLREAPEAESTGKEPPPPVAPIEAPKATVRETPAGIPSEIPAEAPAEAPATFLPEGKPAEKELPAGGKEGAGIPAAAPPVPAETPAAAAPGVSTGTGEPPLEEKKQEVVPPAAEPRTRKPPAEAKPLTPVPGTVNGPEWAKGNEELVFRVEFLGMTMGYARFTFKGKKEYNGKEVFHLTVRAWTSDFLSIIYPINDTIDYYLDVKTLAPLRQEYTSIGKKGKDDIAFYDQEKGKILYKYKKSGEIRKQVEVPPEVHDPVSVAYYFRTRDLGAEGRPRNVYAGRKLWNISTRTLGVERIDTRLGPLDAIVVQPIIKRDGQTENKGDLRMWMTNDARHVPVKIYAKFKKIKMWTLTAELMPAREGG